MSEGMAAATAAAAAPAADTYLSILGAAALVALSGLFSGLNLGLMSFTEDDLRVIIEGSTDADEIAHAQAIRPIRARGNLLLCTLLLGNTLVNAVIAVLLSDLTSGLIGTLVTTALILVFGEIIPQSVCSRHALFVGATVLPLVQIFLFVCYPVCYPISLLLDWLLGREISGVLSRTGLLALVRLNVESEPHAQESNLTAADAKLLGGALTFVDKTVEDVMTPLEHVYSLPRDAMLDQELLMDILRRGPYSRIPVYDGDRSNIVGLLFCKDLLGVGFERALPLAEVLDKFQGAARLHMVPPTTKLREAMDTCQMHRCHMLVVSRTGAPGGQVASPALGCAARSQTLEQRLHVPCATDGCSPNSELESHLNRIEIIA